MRPTAPCFALEIPAHFAGRVSAATMFCVSAAFTFGAYAQTSSPQIAQQTTPRSAPSSPAPKPLKVVPSKVLPPSNDVSPEQVFYQMLLAEIAGQRGQLGLASEGMLDLARKTRDARVARRAAELAFQARQTELAQQALVLWLSIEPDSTMARQALGVLAGVQGDFAKLSTTLQEWFHDHVNAPTLFMQLVPLLQRVNERQAARELVERLAASYQDLPEARFAVASAAYVSGDMATARAKIEEALNMNPAFDRAAIVKAEFLRSSNSETAADDAAAWLESYLKANPNSARVRVVYARQLAANKALLTAREEFRRAARDLPGEAEPVFASGLISLQIEDFTAAEAELKRVLDLSPRDRNPVFFNLGLAAEGRKDVEAALLWFRQVSEGNYLVAAKRKIAGHLTRRDGIKAGRAYLKAEVEDADNAEVRTQLILAEVQLLREAKAWQEAHDLLTEALRAQPQSVELRYDRAMIADKLGRFDDLEADLRLLLTIKPDHAHALNALGYSLAERGIRLAEAEQLIRKAITHAPDDGYIIDSLGWVQFKLGRAEEALQTLQRAYRLKQDPEIAAHLGEVMWSLGKREEARMLWQRALLEAPDNPALQGTIKRLQQ